MPQGWKCPSDGNRRQGAGSGFAWRLVIAFLGITIFLASGGGNAGAGETGTQGSGCEREHNTACDFRQKPQKRNYTRRAADRASAEPWRKMPGRSAEGNAWGGR